ncbi:MAG: copper resistance CopC/CopD family protein [Candidatus Limnocylindrales bacterium]
MHRQRGPARGRLLTAGFAAVGLALALVLSVGVATALGHSQLVSSSPGAGQVVAQSPTQIRLIFSEPIEGRYTSLDLLDGSGTALLVGVGSVDPADPNALVVQIVDPLPDGVYSINWRAVSAADGHSTNGFLSFGIGTATLPAGSGQTSANVGDLHAGHTGSLASLEVFAKTIGDGGPMLAFGLWIFGLLVLVPVRGRIPGGLVLAQVAGMVAGAVGAVLLIWVSLVSLPASPQGPDLVGFLFGTRIGQLLTARTALAVGAWVLGLILVGRHGDRRTALVSALLGVSGAAYLVLVALMGHSAAFSPPIPLVLDIVHLGAAAIWISGLAALAMLTGFGGGPVRAELREIVPRFSALALASGGLLAATGIYAAWDMTHDFTNLGTSYTVNLALKVALVAAAFALGAVNLFDGGRDRYAFGLARRVAVEAALAFAILVATANLTSGSPTGEGRPIAITPVPTTAGTTVDASLAIQPGTPGPNQLWVGLARMPPSGATVSVVLQRLDSSTGTSTIPMSPATAVSGVSGAAAYTASGLVFAPDSEWDASVIVTGADGAELGRARFDYAFDATNLSAGEQIPLLDPALLVGILLLGGGLLGFAFWIGGGRPPLVEMRLGRRALALGSVLGGLLGVLVLVGPR